MKTCIKLLLVLSLVLVSCKGEPQRIKLATTTSTENSGLLAYLLPMYTKDSKIEVDVIAVGTGKALTLAQNGDVDVVMVHARSLEDKFVEEGFGIDRKDLMYNDFILVGTENYTAKLNDVSDIVECFRVISNEKMPFISRGDNSGTHVKENIIWELASIKPTGEWYKEIGQGMEQALTIAYNSQAITLSDRGTYLSMKENMPLNILYEHDELLANPYGVIAVNPAKWEHVKYKQATNLINWLVSDKGQKAIADFKVDGEQLFFPVNIK